MNTKFWVAAPMLLLFSNCFAANMYVLTSPTTNLAGTIGASTPVGSTVRLNTGAIFKCSMAGT